MATSQKAAGLAHQSNYTKHNLSLSRANLPDGEVVELPVLPVELLAHRQQPALRVKLEGAPRLRLQGVGDLDSQKSIL